MKIILFRRIKGTITLAEKGSILMYTALTSVIALIIGLSIVEVVISELGASDSAFKSQSALYAAESGVEYVKSRNNCVQDRITIWLDSPANKIGFSAFEESGVIYSTGIAYGIRRDISVPSLRKIDLVLDNAGIVSIDNLPSPYACMNAKYTNLVQNSNIGDDTIFVNDISGFSRGSKVLLAQMKNASGSNYNEVLDLYGGQQEFIIKEIDTALKKVTLESTLARNFPATYTQVINIRNFNSVKLLGNTTLTAPAYNGIVGGILNLNSSSFIEINTNSSIDMTAKGYRGNEGPGAGRGGLTDATNPGFFGSASGAGYAAVGGSAAGPCNAPGGLSYGSANGPLFMGSGGGIGHCMINNNGKGGGLIRISANFLNIKGIISSDGGGGGGSSGYASCPSGYSGLGGGSGGGIEISSPTISFSGFLSSAGGGGSEWRYWWSGQNGYLGKGGDGHSREPGCTGITANPTGGIGGFIGSPVGNGGNGSWGAANGGNGGFCSGGGGVGLCENSGGSTCFTGGGGGTGGRILIKYSTFNGGLLNSGSAGYADAPGASNKIGPYAYFIKI